jgi:hypothetical protein
MTLPDDEWYRAQAAMCRELAARIRFERDNPSPGTTHKVSYKLGLTRALKLIEEHTP